MTEERTECCIMERILSYKKFIIPSIVVLFVVGYFLFTHYQNKMIPSIDDEWLVAQEETKEVQQEQSEQEQTNVMVDIKGAVNRPGVYQASRGERVIDLVNRAGGLTDQAAEAYVNFAMYVEDEMVIYIPAIGEEEQVIHESVQLGGLKNSDGKVNINQASQSELETLPGIGPAKAMAIIEHREKNGLFQKIEDLMLISGIGEKTFEKLAEQITVK